MSIMTLAQAVQQGVGHAITMAELKPYLEAAILLAGLAAFASIMVFFRQKRIAQNQVDMAQLIAELIERHK